VEVVVPRGSCCQAFSYEGDQLALLESGRMDGLLSNMTCCTVGTGCLSTCMHGVGITAQMTNQAPAHPFLA
jgi:hypothetical protein